VEREDIYNGDNIMRDLDKQQIQDDIRRVLIMSAFNEIDLPKTAHELNTQTERAVEKYLNDSMFNAIVNRQACAIMEIFHEATEGVKYDR
jgi:hypothetical protein